MENESRTFSGSTLKIIAVVSMLIDHIAVVILDRVLVAEGFVMSDVESLTVFQNEHPALLSIYFLMRLLGRLAFPIFAFLLIEGIEHTKHMGRYALRLFLFAVISEVPFDLANHNEILEPTYQNVLFTLFLGLVTIVAIKQAEYYLPDKKFMQGVIIAVFTLAIMYIADIFSSDYGAFGILAIVLMYLCRKHRMTEMFWCCVVLTCSSFLEITSFACIPLVMRYNGERGLKIKYLFYLFYPLHLLLLYLIAYLMGLVGPVGPVY